MQTFVINLKRRPDRLESFRKDCPLQNVQVVEAFDASKEDHELIHSRFNKLQFPGEKGCWLSHLLLWEKIVKEGLPHALIFEDDAKFYQALSRRNEVQQNLS